MKVIQEALTTLNDKALQQIRIFTEWLFGDNFVIELKPKQPKVEL